jgi:hypothetical protein
VVLPGPGTRKNAPFLPVATARRDYTLFLA